MTIHGTIESRKAGVTSTPPFLTNTNFSEEISVGKSNITKTCAIRGCEIGGRLTRGWCRTHYGRWIRNGDPLIRYHNQGEGDTAEKRFWSRILLTADDSRCWVWQGGKSEGGYGVVSIEGKQWLAHRFAWFLLKGVEPSLQLLHSCPGGDNPACVNPNHLREGTFADNARDAAERGQLRCKLNKDQVREIRQQVAEGQSSRAIGERYGVAQQTISNIRTGVSWGWLK